MNGKDRKIVAAILALGLLAGIWAVNRGLEQARRRQEAAMAAARQELESLAPLETEDAPAPTLPELVTQPGALTPDPGTTEVPGSSGAEPSGPQGGGSAPVVQTAQPPRMGQKRVSVQELSDWLQEESLEAQAAKSELARANALGAGIGSGADGLLRGFAASQGPDNYQAARNRLDRQGAQLGYGYLQCQWDLRHREETRDYYKQLLELIRIHQRNLNGATDIGLKMEAQVYEDLEQVEGLYAQAELDLAAAELALAEAAQAINLAVGNPPGEEITVTGELKPTPLPKGSEEEWVASALEQRNERKGAAHQLRRAEETLVRLRYEYAPSSPEILEQQRLLAEAQMALPELENQITGEIGSLRANMELLHDRLEQRKDQVEEYLEERPVPVYQLDTAGQSNLDQLRNQWNGYLEVMGQYGADCVQLAMAVRDLGYATGVGLVTAELT